MLPAIKKLDGLLPMQEVLFHQIAEAHLQSIYNILSYIVLCSRTCGSGLNYGNKFCDTVPLGVAYGCTAACNIVTGWSCCCGTST